MATEPQTYSPSEAAALLGVHANSVRLWTTEFAPVLSAGAQARPRVLTSGDVAALQVIRDLRRQGVPTPEIVARILQTPAAELQRPAVEHPAAPTSPPEGAGGAIIPFAVAQVYQGQLDDARARLLALEQRQGDTDQRTAALERRRDWLILLLAVLVVGLALGILLGLALSR